MAPSDTIVFDTLAAAGRLRTAGMPEAQAAAVVTIQAELVEENFATKADLERMQLALDARFAETRTEIAELRTEVKTEIAELRTEIAELRAEVKTEIAELRAEVKTEIAGLRAELRIEIAGLRAEIADIRTDIIKWILGMQIAIAAVVVAAVKVL